MREVVVSTGQASLRSLFTTGLMPACQGFLEVFGLSKVNVAIQDGVLRSIVVTVYSPWKLFHAVPFLLQKRVLLLLGRWLQGLNRVLQLKGVKGRVKGLMVCCPMSA